MRYRLNCKGISSNNHTLLYTIEKADYDSWVVVDTFGYYEEASALNHFERFIQARKDEKRLVRVIKEVSV